MNSDIMYQEQIGFADKMAAKYPELFSRRGVKGSCLERGIGVNKGWWPLIEEACQFLEEKRKSGISVYFVQIKEKFAALTIYLNGDFSKEEAVVIHEKINDIHDRSLVTCEFCGVSDGVTVCAPGGFWLKAVCPKCCEEKSKKSDINTAREVLEKLSKECS